MNKYVIRLEVPEDIWNQRKTLEAAEMPVGWDAVPAARASEQTGSDWYEAEEHLILEVPSVIVPEEKVTLLNASMDDITKVDVVAIRRYEYNAIFRRPK